MNVEGRAFFRRLCIEGVQFRAVFKLISFGIVLEFNIRNLKYIILHDSIGYSKYATNYSLRIQFLNDCLKEFNVELSLTSFGTLFQSSIARYLNDCWPELVLHYGISRLLR